MNDKEREILNLIEKISPQAKEYVEQGYEKKIVEVFYYDIIDANKGVFLVVNDDECQIYFASFVNAVNQELLDLIKEKTIIDLASKKEVCFNVYGENSEIIKLVREIGFKVDMEGYHMQYFNHEVPKVTDTHLAVKGYETWMSRPFAEAFSLAYNPLCMDNGWETNWHLQNEEIFGKSLEEYNRKDQLRSFWLEDELVGAYLIYHEYIKDLVIHPKFQNQGYGSLLLFHCMNKMKNDGLKNIRLRVAKSNVGAKRLYERYNFYVIASFAEHTYKK